MKTLKDIENELNNSERIKFLPYVGKYYDTVPRKILILGESHYGKQERNNYRRLTRDVVELDYLADVKQGKKNTWIRCYRNTAAVLTGKGYYSSEYVWNDLSYYNFFQQVVGDKDHKDKKYITNQLIEDSRVALGDVLNILSPDFVIVWGYSKIQWNWLPQQGQVTINSSPRIFSINGFSQIPFWCMRHPSSGFSIERHRNQ